MPKIISFEKINRGRYDRASIKNHASSAPCTPPIETERIDHKAIIIRFLNTCFNPEIVEFALGRVKNGQDFWRLYKLNEESRYFNSLCMTFMVVIDKPPKNQIDEAFRQIVSMMTKEIYIRELSAWPSKTSVDELTKAYQLDYSVGAVISPQIARLLKSVGIENAYDLVQLSREELCAIPGITTQDIFKIEKSLAARGLFLATKEVPRRTTSKTTAIEG